MNIKTLHRPSSAVINIKSNHAFSKLNPRPSKKVEKSTSQKQVIKQLKNSKLIQE